MSTTPLYYNQCGQCDFLEIDENELNTSSLYARPIYSPNRDRLISRRQLWPSSPSNDYSEDVAFLAELSRLAPSVAKNFMPKSHVESRFTLRLINDINFQGEEESYIAMSYCWKRIVRNTSRRVVTPLGDLPFGWQKEVEQFPLPTSSALFQAVLRERRKNEGLWFDQVCIDQEDDAERVATIGATDIIYQNARAVVIILDDITIPPEEEQLLRYFYDQYSFSDSLPRQQPTFGMNPPFMHQYNSIRSFFERILSSVWFDRAWCAHEMRSAQNRIFLVPSDTSYGDGIQNVIRFDGTFFLTLISLANELHDLSPVLNLRMRSLVKVFRPQHSMENCEVQRPDTPHASTPDESSLVSTFDDIFRQNAGGNPKLPEYLRRLDANRDKLSIALSTSGLPLVLAPTDPFSRPYIEDECLRSLLLVALAARDPLALCTTGTPLRLHDGSISWLCRPSPLDVSTSLPRFNRNGATIVQSSDGQAEFAQLDLIFLDLPHRTCPNPMFPTHVARARTFIDTCIRHGIPGTGLWNFSHAPEHPRSPGLRNCFIQTLACIFDCGPHWLLDTLSSMPQAQLQTQLHGHNPALDAYTLSILFAPHLHLESYLAHPENHSTASTLLTLVANIIATGIPWSSGAAEHTHGPLLVTSPSLPSSPSHTTNNPFATSSSSQQSPHTPQHKALIFAPFAHSKTLLVAIPSAVKDSRYKALARGWILTSMNPFTGVGVGMGEGGVSPRGNGSSVSWTLQGKGVVFGGMGFVEGVERVGEGGVRRHRVYGGGGGVVR